MPVPLTVLRGFKTEVLGKERCIALVFKDTSIGYFWPQPFLL